MDNNTSPQPDNIIKPGDTNTNLDNTNKNLESVSGIPDSTNSNGGSIKGNVNATKNPHWYSWSSFSKKRKITVAVLVIVLVAGGVLVALRLSSPTKSTVQNVTPATVASPLTGVQVAPSMAARPVSAIMIENSDAARPQSGLQDAGVVFEAIAEGGVTRFIALYQESSPQYIGPVRSLRPYYIDYAAPFQATIVHVGGSPDALSQIVSGNYRNLDQFSNNSYFQRINSRQSPHDVYTSFSQVDKFNNSKNYTHSSFTSWPRKADAKLVTPTAKKVNLNISAPDFYAQYTYNSTANSYMRSEGGVAHKELVSASDKTGVQLNPKVVVGMVVPLSNGTLDSSGAYYSNYADTGSGKAYIFQDGGVTIGTWSKSGTSGQLSFSDAQGKPVQLNRGQTWVTLLSDANQVAYSAN